MLTKAFFIQPVVLVVVSGLLLALPARAQSDSDASGSDDPSADSTDADAAAPPPPRRVPKAPPPVKAAPAKVAPAKVAAPADAARPAARPILTPNGGDAEVVGAWRRWQKATSDGDVHGAETAQKELLVLKEDLGVEDLNEMAVGFLRAAEVRLSAHDTAGAVALCRVAADLAPDLVGTHVTLAHALFADSAFSFGSWTHELKLAATTLWRDPRYFKPAVADVGAALGFALLATAVVVLAVLALKRGRYFLHDFHHLFPRATARWQSTVAAALLLLVPVVFRLGFVPTLLVVATALTLYVDGRERIILSVLLLTLIALPLGGGLLAQQTSFAGTPAEDAFVLDQGGLDAKAAADHVRLRVAEDRATYGELFTLARYETRRGKLDDAIVHFKQAASLRTNDPRLLTNMGNALLTKGDVEGAAELYTNATQVDPTLAPAFFDLGKLYARRAVSMPDDTVGMELDRAQTALATAQRLDEALYTHPDPPADHLLGNRLLLSPSLTAADLTALADAEGRGSKVTAQLSGKLLGGVDYAVASAVMGLFVLALAAVGFWRSGKGIAKSCEKCGRAVCRRCDPELGAGSMLCNQCVHAFARSSSVAPALKVRKQIEIHQYQQRQNRTAYLLGALCSGMGHLFTGLAVRGVLLAYAFLFILASVALREGVVRTPFGPLAQTLWLVPLLLAIVSLYGLSLRSLHRRQTE